MAEHYLKRYQIAKIPSLYYEIDVVENDGDDRIRTGSTHNGVYVRAQRKW